MEMPFGKYVGTEVSELPTKYLEWLTENCDLYGDLEEEIEAELQSRYAAKTKKANSRPPNPEPKSSMPTAGLQPIVRDWYRDLARRYHPDAGGSDAEMSVVNTAHERLLRALAQRGRQTA